MPLMLGSCKEVVISDDEMVILGGAGSQSAIEERRSQVFHGLLTSFHHFIGLSIFINSSTSCDCYCS